jgi:predicted nucleic acid-binding protein
MLNFSIGAQADFFEWILKKGVSLCDVECGGIPRVIQLMRKYSGLPMDFADVTLVLAAEKTGLRSIVSVDSDFDIYRLPGKEKIHNIFCDKDSA